MKAPVVEGADKLEGIIGSVGEETGAEDVSLVDVTIFD